MNPPMYFGLQRKKDNDSINQEPHWNGEIACKLIEKNFDNI